jgi:hypothetical protein
MIAARQDRQDFFWKKIRIDLLPSAKGLESVLILPILPRSDHAHPCAKLSLAKLAK